MRIILSKIPLKFLVLLFLSLAFSVSVSFGILLSQVNQDIRSRAMLDPGEGGGGTSTVNQLKTGGRIGSSGKIGTSSDPTPEQSGNTGGRTGTVRERTAISPNPLNAGITGTAGKIPSNVAPTKAPLFPRFVKLIEQFKPGSNFWRCIGNDTSPWCNSSSLTLPTLPPGYNFPASRIFQSPAPTANSNKCDGADYGILCKPRCEWFSDGVCDGSCCRKPLAAPDDGSAKNARIIEDTGSIVKTEKLYNDNVEYQEYQVPETGVTYHVMRINLDNAEIIIPDKPGGLIETTTFLKRSGSDIAINGPGFDFTQKEGLIFPGIYAPGDGKYIYGNEDPNKFNFYIDKNNRFSFNKPPPSQLNKAIAVENPLIVDGKKIKNGRIDVDPRTAVGMTASGELILVVVDGISDKKGMTLDEVADILLKEGAIIGASMDGGTSSTLVRQEGVDENGNPIAIIVNNPDGRNASGQSPVATFIGIKFPTPTP